VTDKILLAREGGLVRLTIANPDKLNAIDFAMWQDLHRAMEQVAQDDSVRCEML
jgi:enoyl-CoA hydratase/carnithine racemase